MKKLMIPIMAALFLFTACSHEGKTVREQPKIPMSFSTNLQVMYKDNEINAAWEFLPEGNCITIKTPESVAGMELIFSGSECSVKYKGLEFETDLSRFPQSVFGSILVSAFETSLNTAAVTTTYKNDCWLHEGTLSTGGFTLAQNSDGTLKYLSVPSLDLTINFSEFKIN